MRDRVSIREILTIFIECPDTDRTQLLWTKFVESSFSHSCLLEEIKSSKLVEKDQIS